MFVRIVKMSISPENIDLFLKNFHENKEKIRNFNGCRLLELYRDKTQNNIFFTYSYWDTTGDLENYRKSELFKIVWSNVKPLFNDRPFAWSVDKIVTLP